MYLRLVQFQTTSRDTAQNVAVDFLPQVRALQGCLSGHCYFDAQDGQGGLSVLWDTKENADAAAAKMQAKLEALLKGKTSAPPSIRLFPVVG